MKNFETLKDLQVSATAGRPTGLTKLLGTLRQSLAALIVTAIIVEGSASAAVPGPGGSGYHEYATFDEVGAGAYTGVYQRRPDVEPPVGMPPPGCATAFGSPVVYYPQWVILTDSQTGVPPDWVEIGSAFHCQGGHYWFAGYGAGGVFHPLPPLQWGFAPSTSRYFQIYRTAEVWHFLVGNTEIASLPWNAVGVRVAAGLETYNIDAGTAYTVHDQMNKTLSEGGWIAYSGTPYTSGTTRVCSFGITGSSFQEKQAAPGTGC